MNTQTNYKIREIQHSVYLPLFHHLLFETPTARVSESDSFEESYYYTSPNFDRLVFANGSLDPDDQYYILNAIWTFASKTTVFDKTEILVDFMNSEKAYELIDQELENDAQYLTKNDEEAKIAKSVVFELLFQEMKKSNKFPESVEKWLFNKCENVALNCNEMDGGFYETDYKESFSNLLKV